MVVELVSDDLLPRTQESLEDQTPGEDVEFSERSLNDFTEQLWCRVELATFLAN